MNAMAYVTHASPLPGSGLYVDGWLRFEQRDALPASSTRHDYNYSVFPFAQHGEAAGDTREAASLRLPVILNEYLFRNETAFLVGTDGWCSPRHRMPFNSTNEGSKRA